MILKRMVFAFLLLLCTSAVPFAYGADLLSQFHPYISLKEAYIDNIYLTSTNKKDDYITTVQPGIRFSNMDIRGGVDLDYSLGAVFYGNNSNLNQINHNASLNAKYMTEAHVNFYLRESFIRSDEPQEREYFTATEENKYMLTTRTERKPYWRNVVEPTIEYQFGPEDRLGVKYRNNIYRTESASGQNSREDFINPFFSYWFDKQNGISLQYGLTYGAFEKYPDLTGNMASARYIYRFSPKTSVFTEYTYLKRSFKSSESQFKTDYDIHEPSVGMTFAISPTLNASVQVGYFWVRPKTGSGEDGLSYKAELANRDLRTTYILSLQGGYAEDYFTYENLGFARYHRLTGSLKHMLDRKLSIGCLGRVERAEYVDIDREDTIWEIGGNASYMPLKWLTLSLDVTHLDRKSNIDLNSYTENRAIFTITVTY
jgi:hypothetical protein